LQQIERKLRILMCHYFAIQLASFMALESSKTAFKV